jgi:ABC-type tungstate transport system permease subunit
MLRQFKEKHVGSMQEVPKETVASCDRPLNIPKLLGTCAVPERDPRTGLHPLDKDEWANFIPPPKIPISHPWLTRFSASLSVYFDNGSADSNIINTRPKEIYGDPAHPVLLNVGAGTLGMTSLLQELAPRYIRNSGDIFRIGWMLASSRFSQVALLADIVQVSFCTESHNQRLGVEEGWCRMLGNVLHDHMIVLGPAYEAKFFPSGCSLRRALKAIYAKCPSYSNKSRTVLFRSGGDGSDSFIRKQKLFQAAGVDLSNAAWDKNYAPLPDAALRRTAAECGFSLIDRSLYLHRRRQPYIGYMRVVVEGDDPNLFRPVTVLVNDTDTVKRQSSAQAARNSQTGSRPTRPNLS